MLYVNPSFIKPYLSTDKVIRIVNSNNQNTLNFRVDQFQHLLIRGKNVLLFLSTRPTLAYTLTFSTVLEAQQALETFYSALAALRLNVSTGGTPTLQEVSDAGNGTTNDLLFLSALSQADGKFAIKNHKRFKTFEFDGFNSDWKATFSNQNLTTVDRLYSLPDEDGDLLLDQQVTFNYLTAKLGYTPYDADVNANGYISLLDISTSSNLSYNNTTGYFDISPNLTLINTSASGLTGGAGIDMFSNDGAAISSGDRIGNIGMGGYDGNDNSRGAGIQAWATQNWSNSARGARLTFDVIANNSNVSQIAAQIDQNKDFTFYGKIIRSGQTGLLKANGDVDGTAYAQYMVCGISNALGVFTSYATLQDAMTAVSAGQTIEIFADVTLAAGLSLTKSCNINFNGHTVSLTHATEPIITFNAVGGELNLFNGKLVYTGTGTGTGGTLYSINNSTVINCQGMYFCSNTTATTAKCINLTASGPTINNAFCIVLGNGAGIYISDSNGSSNNCVVIIKGNGNGIQGGYSANNCIVHSNAVSSSYFAFYSTLVNNSVAIVTNTSTGIGLNNGNANNCFVFNNSSGIGISPNNGGYVSNCTVFTTSGACIDTQSGYGIKNCVLRKSGGTTAALVHQNILNPIMISNNDILSVGGPAISLAANPGGNFNNSHIIGNTIESQYNNAAGHGIAYNISAGTGLHIYKNFIIVANSSAYSISASSANSAKIAQNIYKNATVPVHANITQEAFTSIDANGNIKI